MSTREAARKDFQLLVLRMYCWVLRCFPTQFREQFGGELLQVLSTDLQNPRPDASLLWRTDRILENLADLVASAACERVLEWRNKMNKKWILQILGIVLLSFWVILMSWGLGRNLLHWNVKDPYLLILGEFQSDVEVVFMDGTMFFAPLLAFVMFLIPLFRLKFQPGEGVLVQVSIRQPGRFMWILLGVSGLSAALWLGLIFLARLFG